MKNFIFIFIIVTSLHLIFFTNIKVDPIIKKNDTNKISKTHTNIKYVRLKQAKISKPIKKIIERKKQVRKKIVKKHNITKKRVRKKIIKKPKKKIVKKSKKIKTKTVKKIKQVKPIKKKQPSSLESMFLTKTKDKPVDKLTQSYLNLYGDEYKKFTKEQKKYLKDNLKDIGLITQRYLMYPDIAARTRQYGTNVVEFYLHPNGDISDLKLIHKLYYTSLDENSIYTIEIAYKDYPRPKTKTKIRIYINYRLR
jgi:protein TonB